MSDKQHELIAKMKAEMAGVEWGFADRRGELLFDAIEALEASSRQEERLIEVLTPFVSDDAIYLTGCEKPDDEHAIWVTTTQILEARVALEPPRAKEQTDAE
jgi:hypothetical protein